MSNVRSRVRPRLRQRRGRLGDTWHLDELFVTIDGRQQFLWRAVDEDGDVLDILGQSRRIRRACGGRGSPGQDGKRVATATAVNHSRSHHREREEDRTATMEDGAGLSSAGPSRERVCPVQVDHWGWSPSPDSKRAALSG